MGILKTTRDAAQDNLEAVLKEYRQAYRDVVEIALDYAKKIGAVENTVTAAGYAVDHDLESATADIKVTDAINAAVAHYVRTFSTVDPAPYLNEIGRASCRERV